MNEIASIRILPVELPTSPTAPVGEDTSFSETPHGALNDLGDLQGKAQSQVQNLMSGQTQDLHSAMIAVEKADLSFQLMLQVRNKIVQAYQEVSRLQF